MPQREERPGAQAQRTTKWYEPKPEQTTNIADIGGKVTMEDTSQMAISTKTEQTCSQCQTTRKEWFLQQTSESTRTSPGPNASLPERRVSLDPRSGVFRPST